MSIEQSPIVILGFSGEASPFDPFWPATHRALLPVCGKSIIVHLMESLAQAGYRHVRVAGSVQHHSLRRRLGNGEEWGLRIRYTDIHAPDLVSECLAANSRCLSINGDELHAYTLDCSGADWQEAELPQRIPTGPARLWQVAADGTVAYRNAQRIAADGWFRMGSVREYHEANQQLVAGELGLVVPGAPLHDFQAYVDWRTEIAADAYIGSQVFIGKHACVDSQARLERNCVLANGVIIGAGCRLENVTLLPNCQIRQGVDLRDAVVTPEGIYDLSKAAEGAIPLQEARDVVVRSRSNQEATTGLPEPMACRSRSTI